MIGNDVVDLKAAAKETNWRRNGYLEKVFSQRERKLLSEGAELHQMVWLMWSMKEAAYKARQRQLNIPPSLNWQAFECSRVTVSCGKASGEVHVEGRKYFTTSEITSENIHTYARDKQIELLKNQIFEAASPVAKRQLLKQISILKAIPLEELSLQKNSNGIPYISCRGNHLDHPFSLSDHGRFSAFSLSLRMS